MDLRELVKVGNKLDWLGLVKEASLLDQILKKIAEEMGGPVNFEEFNSTGSFPGAEEMKELFFRSYAFPSRVNLNSFIGGIRLRYNSASPEDQAKILMNLKRGYPDIADGEFRSSSDPEALLTQRLKNTIYREIVEDDRVSGLDRGLKMEELGALMLEDANSKTKYKMSASLREVISLGQFGNLTLNDLSDEDYLALKEKGYLQ